MRIRDDKLRDVEVPQTVESLSENGQGRRSFLKNASKAVYVAPVLFALSHNALGREAPGKSAPGRTPPGNNTTQRGPAYRTMSITDPPPPPLPPPPPTP